MTIFPKPFSPKILLYKIAAIFRRGSSDTQKQTSIVYKDLCMDIDGFHLYHKGKEIVLTQKEFSLLRLMLENKGKFLPDKCCLIVCGTVKHL